MEQMQLAQLQQSSFLGYDLIRIHQLELMGNQICTILLLSQMGCMGDLRACSSVITWMNIFHLGKSPFSIESNRSRCEDSRSLPINFICFCIC